MKGAPVLFLTLGLTSLAPQSGACWWPNRVLKRYFGSDDTTTLSPTTVVPDPARDTTIFAAPTAPEQYATVPFTHSDNFETSDGVALASVTATPLEATTYTTVFDPDDRQTTMLAEPVKMSTAAMESNTMPTEASTVSPVVSSSTAPPDFESPSDDELEPAPYDHYSTDVSPSAFDSISTVAPNEVTNVTLTLVSLAPDNPSASTFDSGHTDSFLQPTAYSNVVADTTAFVNSSSVLTGHNEDLNVASTQFATESFDSTVTIDYNWNSTIGTQSSVPSHNTAFVPEPTPSTTAKNIGTAPSLSLSSSNISVSESTTDVTTVAATQDVAFSPGTIAHATGEQEPTSLAQSLFTTPAATRPHDDNALELTSEVHSEMESTESQTSAVTMSSRPYSVIEDIGIIELSTPVFQSLESETLPAITEPPASAASMEPNSSALIQDETNHNERSTPQQPVVADSVFPSSTVTPELPHQTEGYPQRTSTAPEATASRRYKPVYVRRFTPWLIKRTSSTTAETATLRMDDSTPTSVTVISGHLQVDPNSPQPQVSPTLQPVSVSAATHVRRSSNRGPSDVQTEQQPLAVPSTEPLTDTLVVPESFFGTRTLFNQFGRPYCPGCDARLIKLPARFSIPWLPPYLYS